MPISHTIQEGDSATSLAAEYGLFSETIWADSANADLKKKRKNMDMLLPGDVLTIPDKRIEELSKAPEQRHRFRRKGIPATLRVQLFEFDQPRKAQKYSLIVDGKLTKGTTDSQGVLQEFIAPTAREARIIIGPDQYEVVLQLGQIDPPNELSGVQKRLTNLGYDTGGADGKMNPQTEAALRRFQGRFKLKETGKADAATLKKIEEMHESVSQFPVS